MTEQYEPPDESVRSVIPAVNVDPNAPDDTVPEPDDDTDDTSPESDDDEPEVTQ